MLCQGSKLTDTIEAVASLSGSMSSCSLPSILHPAGRSLTQANGQAAVYQAGSKAGVKNDNR